MILKCLEVGQIAANCYIIADEKSRIGAVIDPGAEADRILQAVRQEGIQVKYIILTHGHLDHIGAIDDVRQATGAKVLIHPLDAECLVDPKANLSGLFGYPIQGEPADELLQDGQVLKLEDMELQVIHTPGHSPGGICLCFDGGLFSGDTLFAGSIGRTDFPGGSQSELLNAIKTRLLSLARDTKVYPGHGPATTIGAEADSNPFL